jgi:hypothetical protein
MPTLLRVFVDCFAKSSVGVAKLKLVGVMVLPFWMKLFSANSEGNHECYFSRGQPLSVFTTDCGWFSYLRRDVIYDRLWQDGDEQSDDG